MFLYVSNFFIRIFLKNRQIIKLQFTNYLIFSQFANLLICQSANLLIFKSANFLQFIHNHFTCIRFSQFGYCFAQFFQFIFRTN